MILSRLMGGLGNQMFQYALGRSISEKLSTELKLDLHLLLDHSLESKNEVHRNFELDIFKGPFELASKKESDKFNGKIHSSFFSRALNKCIRLFKPLPLVIEKDRSFHQSVLNTNDNNCLIGGWQSEKYFEMITPVIRKTFQFKQEEDFKQSIFYKHINSSTSVSFHVRRGDYVSSPKYLDLLGEQPISYYKEAYDHMKKKLVDPHFYIFSDDIDWCKENLSFIENLTFVESPKNKFGMAQDLFLMTQCKHNVISHSTFSWWGAWLNECKAKEVVAPKNWVSKKYLDDYSIHPKDIVPENWIRI